MAASSGKKGRKPQPKAKRQQQATTDQPPISVAAPAPQAGSLDVLKQNLAGKRKAIFEILEDVKNVPQEAWRDPSQVESLAKNFANKLGLPVPESRFKQFVKAYTDATKNGPTTNVDEIVKKYGPPVDDKTLKEIKKFVPKQTKD
ncbi:hypothetical protein [Alicyclobacillus vulcanalis]|uniref:Uncharacterized protein n=1 Tax=Alicyclobacillus vulcanalis TaxID=252246 RepID=A0A1N7LHI8_9BACL|nr:hypothetical protein [Alicyclobacillus vulcanalis]SIS73269.1 hypothetical protein SAMN05421799_103147 [Alicyclobacillus vulcanalis]